LTCLSTVIAFLSPTLTPKYNKALFAMLENAASSQSRSAVAVTVTTPFVYEYEPALVLGGFI